MTVIDDEIRGRATRFAALGDPLRLAIVDDLAGSDRTSTELQARFGLASNLLAHHLDILESVGLVSRRRSAGDGRRRYVRLEHGTTSRIGLGPALDPQPALFVCTHNSARSQLAAAWWTRLTGRPALSAGTHPAPRVHPGAVAAAARAGLRLGRRRPQHLDRIVEPPALVVTVCDRAHEELATSGSWLHWSVPDPVPQDTDAAFDAASEELRERIAAVTGTDR